jgi:hypothetical protein
MDPAHSDPERKGSIQATMSFQEAIPITTAALSPHANGGVLVVSPQSITSVATEAQVVTIDEFSHEATPLVLPVSHNLAHSHSQSEEARLSFSDRDQLHTLPPTNKLDNTPKFRDSLFGIVFWVQIVVMVYVAWMYSSAGYQRISRDFNWTQIEQQALADSDDVVTPEKLAELQDLMEKAYEYMQGYRDRLLYYSKVPASIAALVFVNITLKWILKPCTNFMVTSTLLCSVIFVTIIMIALLILEPCVFTLVLTCVVIGAVFFFACTVRSLIPFVTANLKVALEGIGQNLGIYLWAIIFSYVCLIWVVFWVYTFVGLSFILSIRCEDELHPEETQHWDKGGDDACVMDGRIVLLLLLSLYWTINVIINYLRCTVAGVMATWLYAKDDARCCCSSAIWGSLLRGATYSFGSICFGSLVQGAVAVLRCIISSARRNRDYMSSSNDTDCCGGLCFCIVDCVADLGGDMLDYFSQWNYIYIALYGLSYVESGKAVIQLFHFKGWHLCTRGSQSIISERLTSYVLAWVTFVIGVLTGAFVLLIEWIVTCQNPDPEHESYVYGPLPQWRVIAFMYDLSLQFPHTCFDLALRHESLIFPLHLL